MPLFWYTLLLIFSSFAIILKRQRDGCFTFIGLWMSCDFKYSPWRRELVCSVIVVFPDHTHLLFVTLYTFEWSVLQGFCLCLFN